MLSDRISMLQKIRIRKFEDLKIRGFENLRIRNLKIRKSENLKFCEGTQVQHLQYHHPSHYNTHEAHIHKDYNIHITTAHCSRCVIRRAQQHAATRINTINTQQYAAARSNTQQHAVTRNSIYIATNSHMISKMKIQGLESKIQHWNSLIAKWKSKTDESCVEVVNHKDDFLQFMSYIQKVILPSNLTLSIFSSLLPPPSSLPPSSLLPPPSSLLPPPSSLLPPPSSLLPPPPVFHTITNEITRRFLTTI